MSLPIVILFERHWDTIPKLLLQDLLPQLAEQGYDTLAIEAAHDRTSQEIIESQRLGMEEDSEIHEQALACLKRVGIIRELSEISFSSLVELMRLYVSSQRYEIVAEKMKNLPAHRMWPGIFSEMKQSYMELKGIDLDQASLGQTTGFETASKRVFHLQSKDSARNDAIYHHLVSLRQEHRGVVMLCGALHATPLVKRFAEQGNSDDLLYYFPHSLTRYDNAFDDARWVIDQNQCLQGHARCLTRSEVSAFSKRIIQEILPKIRYTKEIPNGNSHSQWLSEYFKVHFQAFIRPNWHVDALIEIINPASIQKIKNRLDEAEIETRSIAWNQKSFFIIPSINTIPIAEKIRKL